MISWMHFVQSSLSSEITAIGGPTVVQRDPDTATTDSLVGPSRCSVTVQNFMFWGQLQNYSTRKNCHLKHNTIIKGSPPHPTKYSVWVMQLAILFEK